MVHVEYIDGTTEDIETLFGYTFNKSADIFCIDGASGSYIMIPKAFVKSIRTTPVSRVRFPVA